MNTTNHALHVHFLQRNQHAFTKLLETCRANQSSSLQTTMSSSAGKSWSRISTISTRALSIDVNAKDELGRTVLHLVCSSTDPASLEYLRLLLAVPAININAPDRESNWTPLHRALYAGNIPAAIQLLQRPDIDVHFKDFEGCTALDVYNTTVHGTAPILDPMKIDASDHQADPVIEFYTWGANRNATLGHTDGDDRTYPDQIEIRSARNSAPGEIGSLYSAASVCDVSMSRFHTVVVTNGSQNNVWMCGIGGSGRLGLSVHTQHGFQQVSPIHNPVVRVAAGQDHTMVLCENGDVLTWGLNRFHQLGYVVETAKVSDEPIQTTPKKVHGPIKKEKVIGIAASKKASACWTALHLYTWGTNTGNLGYDSTPQGAQVVPRRVSSLAEPVTDVAISDNAMVCLLLSKDVMCFSGDTHFKVNFNISRAQDRVFHTLSRIEIVKVVTNEDVFACLTKSGDVYTFLAPSSIPAPTKPQLVWALRRKPSAVRDVALGSDGSLILCTRSGHVFIRTRTAKTLGGKSFKFQQVPFMHRAFRVFANSAGSYGAFCQTAPPPVLAIPEIPMPQSLRTLLPWFAEDFTPSNLEGEFQQPVLSPDLEGEPDDTQVDSQIRSARQIMKYLNQRKRAGGKELSIDSSLGQDVVISTSIALHAHRYILETRCPALLELQAKGGDKGGEQILLERVTQDSSGKPRFIFKGCGPFSVICFLTYLYTDELSSIWDRRISTQLDSLQLASINPSQVKGELLALAKLLRLPALESSLHTVSIALPTKSLSRDLGGTFDEVDALSDVDLEFSDYSFKAHSTILRARSKYFSDFFSETSWNRTRRDSQGRIRMAFPHVRWKAAQVVFAYIYCDDSKHFCAVLGSHMTSDQAMDFVFEVMAIANELLLDTFLQICSNAIIELVTPSNISAALTDASFLQLSSLKRSLERYIATNLGTVLDSCLLDDLPHWLLREVMEGVQTLQRSKHSLTRSSKTYQHLLEKHCAWLSLQDIPATILPSARIAVRESPKLSPLATAISKSSKEPSCQPLVEATRLNTPEAVFAMDDELAEIPAISLPPQVSQSAAQKLGSPWRKNDGPSTRLDFKSIMAETVAASTSPRPLGSPRREVTFGSPKPGLATTPPASQRWAGLSDAGPSPRPSSSRAVSTPIIPAGSPEQPKKGRGQLVEGLARRGSVPPARPLDLTPGMGPTFTPTKVASSYKQQTPKTTKAPWVQASRSSAFPALTPSEPKSFAQIQQQQQQGIPVPQPRLNLREIQEQEAAQRQEQEFLRWWEEEEERVRREEQGATGQPQSNLQSRGKRTNQRSGKSSRGRGGGGGRPVMRIGAG